jgi:hypothetical protein
MSKEYTLTLTELEIRYVIAGLFDVEDYYGADGNISRKIDCHQLIRRLKVLIND